MGKLIDSFRGHFAQATKKKGVVDDGVKRVFEHTRGLNKDGVNIGPAEVRELIKEARKGNGFLVTRQKEGHNVTRVRLRRVDRD